MRAQKGADNMYYVAMKWSDYRKYFTFFHMRFIAGLQYRVAAVAGIVTQFGFGAMEIQMYKAFYQVNPDAFPMSIQALSSYIWLRQALLAIFMVPSRLLKCS